MNPSSSPSWKAKHAWREIDRAEPPKRPAAERVSDFREIYGGFDEATVREQASRCIQCPYPTCVQACPLDSPIPELLSLVADGRFKEAAELLCASQSLPEVFAHSCIGGHPCERACLLVAEAVPISAIERFLLDYAWKHGVAEPPLASPTGQRVAVIGSGICGLVGTDALSRLGYAVTVIDYRQKPGGRMVNGMPGFRVDTALIEGRVELLKKRGVQFHMGVVCGRDVKLTTLRRDFDAVFFALGRAEAIPLEVPGAELRGVYQADQLLQQNKSNSAVDVRGRRVVVLGGGDTALDTLRTAIRHGASDALCIYHRDAANMPASPQEYDNAQEEGARFLFLSRPVRVVGNAAGEVTHIRCVRTELDQPDATGRLGVRPVTGSEFDVPADVVLVAYGFTPPKLPRDDEFADLVVDAHNRMVVDANQMTNLPGVFAGGLVVCGPVPLTQVVRDARKTAAAINCYLAARRLQTGKR